jgi:2,4-dienoyl-CoA reductase (NADPH2)
VELHASHGYLFTQFLSPAINERTDGYGGCLQNRARFLLEVIHAIRERVGNFHLQVKINAVDFNDALWPWEPKGTKLEDSMQVCEWIEQAGVDAVHISIGSIFPHPLLPPGGFPADELNWWYGHMIYGGTRGFMNYTAFHFPSLRPIFLWFWNRTKRDHPIEGVSAEYALEVKKHLSIPVLNTGGYQDGELIERVIREGYCDAVAIARPLVANNDLPEILQRGEKPDHPCSFCNRCLVNAIANPLGCYDVRRFGGNHDAMIREVMSVFNEPGFQVTP